MFFFINFDFSVMLSKLNLLALFGVHFSYIVPIICSILFIIFILVMPELRQDKSKRALLIFLCVWCLGTIALVTWELFCVEPPYPIIDFYSYWFGVVVFPLFYNYIYYACLGRYLPIKAWLKWYAIPVLLIVVYAVAIVVNGELQPVYTWGDLLHQVSEVEMLTRLLALVFYLVYTFLIVGLSVKLYNRYKRDIAQDFSYAQDISLTWIVYVLALFFVFAILSAISFAFATLLIKVIINYLGTILVSTLVLCALRHKTVYSEHFSPLSTLTLPELHSGEEIKKDNYSLESNFKILMDCQQIWKSCDLSADDVVRLLGTNRTYFSRFLQETYQANFRTLVNERRILEAQSLLRSSKSLSIAQVALDMGFLSISSFNLWFKKITGTSPTRYRNSVS